MLSHTLTSHTLTHTYLLSHKFTYSHTHRPTHTHTNLTHTHTLSYVPTYTLAHSYLHLAIYIIILLYSHRLWFLLGHEDYFCIILSDRMHQATFPGINLSPSSNGLCDCKMSIIPFPLHRQFCSYKVCSYK